MLHGGLVRTATEFVPRKNSTLATRPSASCASAASRTFAPRVKCEPSGGFVMAMVGGWFGTTVSVAGGLVTDASGLLTVTGKLPASLFVTGPKDSDDVVALGSFALLRCH